MGDVVNLFGYDVKDSTARTDISAIQDVIPSNASSSNKLATQNDTTKPWTLIKTVPQNTPTLDNPVGEEINGYSEFMLEVYNNNDELLGFTLAIPMKYVDSFKNMSAVSVGFSVPYILQRSTTYHGTAASVSVMAFVKTNNIDKPLCYNSVYNNATGWYIKYYAR